MSCVASCTNIFLQGTERPITRSDPQPARKGIPMNAMAPTRPAELHACRVRLAPGPAAAAEARGQVRAGIRAWEIAVDPDGAVLLDREPGEAIVLAITCPFGQLRVDVHDTSRALPVLVDASADAEAGRGLMLV